MGTGDAMGETFQFLIAMTFQIGQIMIFSWQLKCVSKVLGQLTDSRTSYIATVTFVQRAG